MEKPCSAKILDKVAVVIDPNILPFSPTFTFVEKVAFNSHALIHGHGHNHNNEEKRITLSKLNETDTENEDNEKKEPMVKTEMD